MFNDVSSTPCAVGTPSRGTRQGFKWNSFQCLLSEGVESGDALGEEDEEEAGEEADDDGEEEGGL